MALQSTRAVRRDSSAPMVLYDDDANRIQTVEVDQIRG